MSTKKKQRLSMLIITLIALAALIILRVWIQSEPLQFSMKAAVEERQDKDILQITNAQSKTVNAIYAQVNQTLTEGPVFVTPTLSPTASQTADPNSTGTPQNTEPTQAAKTNTPVNTQNPDQTATATPDKQATMAALKTDTANRPTATPTQTLPPTPTGQIAPEGSSIPGLSPDILVNTLQNSLFTCQDSFIDEQGFHVQICNQATSNFSLVITAYGHDANTINFIETFAFPLRGELPQPAINKIALVAALPYINAQQLDAQEWVLNNIPALQDQNPPEAVTEFGGVSYTIIYEDPDWVFSMGELTQ